MIKILRIINRFNLGGPTYNVSYLSKYMGHEFETMLVGGEHEPGEDSSGFIAENLGLKPVYIEEMRRDLGIVNDFKAYRKLRKLIREYKPDIVHTHASKAGALGRLAASHEKVPVIVHTFHGHVFHSYFSPFKTKIFLAIERFLASKSNRLIAISKLQQSELVHEFKVADEKKFVTISLGFDLSRFYQKRDEKRKVFRNTYGLKDDEVALVIVGRLAPVKNHFLFLDILSEILKNTSQKVKAFIVGDGEMRSEIENYAKDKKIQFVDKSNVHENASLIFTSWITEVDEVLAGCDLVFLTSHNEGTPVSLIEAQAASKPVISTKVGGIADIVAPGAGILFEPEKWKSTMPSILDLVNNTDARNIAGTIGEEFVKSRFHYERLVNDMEQLYRKLLKEKGR